MSITRRLALLESDNEIDLPPRFEGDGLDLSTPLECPEPSLARQSEADSCDINIILSRYQAGDPTPLFQYAKEGFYGDTTEIPDHQEAMNRIVYAEQYFATLPLKIRERFQHQPAALLDFLANNENKQEAIQLGLIPDDTPAAPTAPTPPAPPAPPTGSGTPPVA